MKVTILEDITFLQDIAIDSKNHNYNYLAKVLRAKQGDEIYLINGKEYKEYKYKILEPSKKEIKLEKLEEINKEYLKSNIKINLYFSLIKPDAVANLVTKVTELGVNSINPVLTRYSSVRNINIEKLKKYTIEATRQCGGCVLPKVCNLINLKDIGKKIKTDSLTLFCNEEELHESGERSIYNILLKSKEKIEKQKEVNIIIGPEAGFDNNERELLSKEYESINLGRRILRADTAAICAVSCVQGIVV